MFAVVAKAFSFATHASAAGGIEIGGRSSATGVMTINTTTPEDGSATTTALIGGLYTKTSANARFDYGAGLSLILGDDVTIFTPSFQVRINSNLMGAEENFLLYGGGVFGVAFVEVADITDELVTYGLKAGLEYYFSSDIALQVEDQLLFNDSDDSNTNTITLGIKVLF
jgi:hypothetical protein